MGVKTRLSFNSRMEAKRITKYFLVLMNQIMVVLSLKMLLIDIEMYL